MTESADAHPREAARTVVFDVCDTLFHCNTTYRFIEYVLRSGQHGLKWLLYRLYFRRWSPVTMFLRLIDRVSQNDWSKALAVGLLRDFGRDELYRLGLSFYRESLDRQKLTETHRLLESARSEGKRIILASSSIDPVVSAIADQLRVEFVSTELEYRDGVGTGRIKLELAGRKPDALAARGIEPRTYDVVTDNIGDQQLVAQASHAYVVVSGQRDEAKWANLRPTFIRSPLL